MFKLIHYIQEGELQLQLMKSEEKQYKRGNDSIKGEKTVGTDSILSTP